MKARRFVTSAAVLAVVLLALPRVDAQESVKECMDGIVTRMYATLDQEALAGLNDQAIQKFITPGERQVLATQYWCFDVNVPVVVSVMRHDAQPVAPFWLSESGFQKTDLRAANEEYTYEVWQREFEAGRVELGINGFDKHRSHYFVTVGAQDPGDDLKLTSFFPENQAVFVAQKGTLTYHDWDELVLTKVPEGIEGHVLLSTIRGRAREAHLIGAFRSTPFPSSAKPDQVILTWSEDPQTTQTIQWRTSTETKDGVARFREEDGGDLSEVPAECEVIEDRMLANDRYIHHFTAVLRDLEPGTAYTYTVGSAATETWSAEAEFITAPDDDAPFSFVYFGDTHRSPVWGDMLVKAFERHPETAFYTIAGDVVSTGLNRDDWDHLFEYSGGVFSQRPLLPCIGNHDDQDGLGCWMYLDLFGLPHNGPPNNEPERAYAVEYGNALVLVFDIASPIDVQARWAEKQLAKTDATWKFAVFHFPPYVAGLDYPVIRRLWGGVFDKYHLDFALSGHVHHYLRTHPIKNGASMASPGEGTIYLISLGVPSRERQYPKPDYAAVASYKGDPLYQSFRIDGNKLSYKAYTAEGEVRDELVVVKD